jgi:predicted nucleic acid-binding protein
VIQQTRDVDTCRRELDQLLKQVRIWPLEPGVAKVYSTIYLDLKSRGRVLSQVDMMVAALARIMKLTVLTTDRDFEALPDIRTEDWSR